jgi:nucleoside-triphosphatase THEP1
MLAHASSQSPVRVGKYGVNVEAIDQMAVPSLSASNPSAIVVIDELGQWSVPLSGSGRLS